MKFHPSRLACSIALIAIQSQAATDLQVIQCSGAVQSSSEPTVSISCDGDLLLSSGSISSDGEVRLAATRSLTLQGLTISGKTVTLVADSIGLSSDTKLTAGEAINISSATPNILPVVFTAQGGADLTAGNSQASLDPIRSGSSYVVNSQNSGGAALVFGPTISIAELPAEPQGGGSVSLNFLAGLLLATVLLSTRENVA